MMYNLSIINQTICSSDAYITCSDWCKGQFYSYHSSNMSILIIVTIIAVGLIMWIDGTDIIKEKISEDQRYHFKMALYFVIMLLQTGLLYYLSLKS